MKGQKNSDENAPNYQPFSHSFVHNDECGCIYDLFDQDLWSRCWNLIGKGFLWVLFGPSGFLFERVSLSLFIQFLF